SSKPYHYARRCSEQLLLYSLAAAKREAVILRWKPRLLPRDTCRGYCPETLLQFHLELRKIDEIPSREFPPRTRFTSSLMCEADDEMHCVVAHLVRRFLRLEIKRAETAVAACGGVKFWVDIKDALAVDIDYSQIGITRTLRFAIIREWKSAVHAGCGVQQLAQTIFKMAAHFV